MRTLAKLTAIELKLFLREPITVIFALVMPLVFLFVLGEVFGNQPDATNDAWSGIGPMNFYSPAYVGLVMASIGVLALPVHLAGYRERGVLRRFRASSVSLWALLGAQVLVVLTITAVSGLVLTVAAKLRYDIELPDSLAGTLLAFLFCAVAFAALGLLLGGLLPTARAAQGVGLIVFFLMLMLGGAGPPREVMTGVMRAIGDTMLLTHVVRVLQGPWLARGWDVVATAAVAAFLLGSAAIALRTFRWE